MTADRIEALLGGGPVTDVRRVFGGNARQAWAFEAPDVAGIVLTRVEAGQLDSDPTDEHRVLRDLAGAGRAPRALAVDPDGEVLGAPSIVLERLPGTADIGAFLKPEDPAQARALTEDLARAAAELHDAPCYKKGQAPFVARGVVEHWEGLFGECRMEPHPVLGAIFGWLREHVPEPARVSVVHGDLRPGNVLTDGERVTALLDWEMAHPGDPAEDIAWAYRPLWSPEAVLSLDDFLRAYDEHAAVAADPAAVRYWRIFSEAKFATISLRAARAFHDGTSANLRLADRAAMVPACLRDARRLIGETGDA